MSLKARITTLSLCLCPVFTASACKAQVPRLGAVNYQSDESRILKIKGIGKDQAVAIASEDASKSGKSLAPFHVIACELVRTWLIVFDGGGPEYVIDKSSGKI